MSKIQVNNHTNTKMKVSINQWGRGGNTSHWSIPEANGNVPGVETWDREDARGFIMTVARDGKGDVPYYVPANTVISLRDESVEQDGIAIAPVGTIPDDEGSTGYTLTVRNNTNGKIKASINQWGKHGNTSNWPIKQRDTETWEREDARGFVMTLSNDKSPVPTMYYVHRSSVIVVEQTGVTDRGVPISPIS